MKFIHTSDIHLDTSFSGAGFPPVLGRRKREAIRATFRRIIDDARLNCVDLLLIAGDLFEHERVTPDTVAFLKQQFESLSPARIFISPGNHDPFTYDSPYVQESWPSNVHIFREQELRTVEVPDLGVRVAGFAFTGSRVEARVLRNLRAQPQDGLNLLVAHASDLSRIPPGKAAHAPFSIEDLIGKGLQYCALGHYHQLRRVGKLSDGAQLWYSGIPEGRGWDEEGACAYLFCEAVDGQITVQPRTCNQYPLQTVALDCDGFSTREQILERLLAESGRSFTPDTILRVILRGNPDAGLDISTAELEERLAGKVLHIVWVNQTAPEIDVEAMAGERTLRGRFVRNLTERIAAAASDEERASLERARLYGIHALLGREVRLR
jgi:DNA repair exonuclease SbcCD nuclease subunit